MTINIPNQEAAVGIPTQWQDTIAAPPGPLFLSQHPPGLTFDYEVAASQTLAAFTVVGFDANKRLVPAALGSVVAIGVLAHAITTPSGTAYKGAKVYRHGHFNHERLIWGASYDTDSKKVMAFEGAPTPTNIRIGSPRTYTP